MKIKETFLALIGLSQERFEKLSAAEQTQLTQLSDRLDAAEAGRSESESNLAASNETIASLTTQLEEASALVSAHSDTITAHEATITAQSATIAAHEATISELRAELAKTPGAVETVINASAAEGEHTPASSTEEPKKYWTSADAELAALKAKMKN